MNTSAIPSHRVEAAPLQRRSLCLSACLAASLSASLSASLALLPAIVHAAPGQPERAESVSASVSFADLDLATDSGFATAKERISTAAKRLCARFSDERLAADRETALDCYRDALRLSQPHLMAAAAAARSERSQMARNLP